MMNFEFQGKDKNSIDMLPPSPKLNGKVQQASWVDVGRNRRRSIQEYEIWDEKVSTNQVRSSETQGIVPKLYVYELIIPF